MVNVDAVLSQYQQAGRSIKDGRFILKLCQALAAQPHVLDKGAIEGIQTRDQHY